MRRRCRHRPPSVSNTKNTMAAVLFAAALATFIPLAHARDVYVSASRGDDGNSGASASAAWRTLARVGSERFAPGDSVNLAAGDTWREPLVLLGSSIAGAGMGGFLEVVAPEGAVGVRLGGWVVDAALAGGGVPPVAVELLVDGAPWGGSPAAAVVVANLSRPDLVPSAAPNAAHGFSLTLPGSASLLAGTHRFDARAVDCGAGCGGDAGWGLPLLEGTSACLCDGAACACAPAPPSPPSPAPPPVVLRTDYENGGAPASLASRQRARIVLDGSGVAVSAIGLPWLDVRSIELAHASSGLAAVAAAHTSAGSGALRVTDSLFRGLWNRSSFGQVVDGAAPANPCRNGWTPSLSFGAGYDTVTVSRCLFEDFDVAFKPTGAMAVGSILFEANTLTAGNGNSVFMTNSRRWALRRNVFTRDLPRRFFACGTTDVMIGGITASGIIAGNELGWRGEHPASPDGCAIDFEGGSDGVVVDDNVIHDSYGAGVMVFGLSDASRNVSNATISRNVFARNGAQQTSGDRGEIAFMEMGSSGVVRDNLFFSVADPAADAAAARAFVFHERVRGTLDAGWTLTNNTLRGAGGAQVAAHMAPMPQFSIIHYVADTAVEAGGGGGGNGAATVTVVNRVQGVRNITVLWTLDGSLPRRGQPGTHSAPFGGPFPHALPIVVNRTAALNVRFAVAGLLDSFTATLVVAVPPNADATCQ